MRNIWSICKRELLSFFVSPIAYFVIVGFVLLAGYFFFNLLGYFNIAIERYNAFRGGMMPQENLPGLNQWVVEPFFYTLLVIMVFLIPIITMRVIAEEKKRGTFELLITSPISVWQIVTGKFLSVAIVILAMLLLAFAFPALLLMWGEAGPELSPTLAGLLALILCGLAFSSISMAVSSFTENQIVAAVCGVVTLLLLYVCHSTAESVGDGPVAAVLNYISPVMQSRELIRGVITFQAIIYFLSLICFGLYISNRAVEAQRWR